MPPGGQVAHTRRGNNDFIMILFTAKTGEKNNSISHGQGCRENIAQ